MAWLCVDDDGTECKSDIKPERSTSYYWLVPTGGVFENLEEGSIERLIGRELTWEDEPVEFTEVAK